MGQVKNQAQAQINSEFLHEPIYLIMHMDTWCDYDNFKLHYKKDTRALVLC